jgi:hypothetical protein
MKYAHVIFLAVAVWAGFISPAAAQDDDSVAAAKFWVENEVLEMLAKYEELVPPDSDLEDIAFLQSLGLEGVVDLQDLRRDFEDEDPPSCAFPTEAALVRMIDLTTDAIVAALNNDPDLAEDLGEDAEDAQKDAKNALETVIDQCREDTGAGVAIVSPTDGDIVEEETIVEGTYDEEALGDNTFWVVILAPNGLFYVQPVYDCDSMKIQPVTLGPLPGEWRVTANFGGEPPQSYTIVLALADPDATDALVDDFLKFCQGVSEFPVYHGLDEAGLEAIQVVDVKKE